MRQLVLWQHFFILMHSALQIFTMYMCIACTVHHLYYGLLLVYPLSFMYIFARRQEDLTFAMLANKTTRETFSPPLTLLVRFEFARYNDRANTELPRPFEIKWPRAIRHRLLKYSQKFTPVKKSLFNLEANTHNNFFITAWNYYYV